MKEIQLSQGKFALVDDEDFDYLNQFKWCTTKYGNTFYAIRNIKVDGKYKKKFMHGVVMNGKGIDHRDMNGLNNQKSNLRFCTKSENAMNMRKMENASSIYKGVHFFRQTGKWQSYITINRKRIHLGYFYSEVEAAKAYNTKAISLFCEFANLNIIPNE